MDIYSSHPEWVLNLALSIDQRNRGFAGDFLRASAERRQVVSAFLAAKPRSESSMPEVGEFLLKADHRSILCAAHGCVPQGLRGALRRAGSIVHEMSFYGLLYSLLAKPTAKDITQCLAHLSSLDLQKLLIIQMLPRSVCRPNVVQAIRSTEEAADVAAAFRLLIDRGVDERLLVEALGQVQPKRGLTKVFRKLVRGARAPQHPIPATEEYVPLRTGEDLYRIASEFRNCLRSYTSRLLDEGSGHAFAVARRDGKKTIVHLTRRSTGWKLEGLFGPRNSRPTRDAREWITRHLVEHGVVVEEPQRQKSSEWDAIRRLTEEHMRGFDFEFELEEFGE